MRGKTAVIATTLFFSFAVSSHAVSPPPVHGENGMVVSGQRLASEFVGNDGNHHRDGGFHVFGVFGLTMGAKQRHDGVALRQG